jgi:hypothetical protein
MRALALLALSATLACGSDAPVITDLNVVGSYILLAQNGHDIPRTESQTATTKVELTAGSLRIDAGGSWSFVHTRQETVAGVTTTKYESPSGLWTREGTTLNFTLPANNTAFSGTFTIGKAELLITRVENGVTNTYLYKQ